MIAPDRHPAFFGYGSLVNRATHDHAPGQPARLQGWRRVWQATRLRPFAFLSAEPGEGAIDGFVAAVPGDNWRALDEREAAYARTPVPHGALSSVPAWAGEVQIYAVEARHTATDARHPILLSYLDVVVQGFLREFGPEGASGFFTTTDGWTAIHDDRADPIYPRHQRLSAAERRFVDDSLAAMGLTPAAPQR